MNHLPRLYFYLTIVGTLLLTILLSANAQESSTDESNTDKRSAIASYDHFKKIKQQCLTKTHWHTIKVHQKCRVTVNSTRCHGYCRSLTDFQLEPPYVTRECSCCRPIGKVTYEVQEHKCWDIQRSSKILRYYTGEKVKIALPVSMTCKCAKCSRVANKGTKG